MVLNHIIPILLHAIATVRTRIHLLRIRIHNSFLNSVGSVLNFLAADPDPQLMFLNPGLRINLH
jgi:hypothetical protein